VHFDKSTSRMRLPARSKNRILSPGWPWSADNFDIDKL
jgi:hypothetical protein